MATLTGDTPKSTREHAVPCRRCRRRMTWNDSAVCDACEAGNTR
jgi:hypothetical protein